MIGKDFQRKKTFLDVRLFVLVLFFLFAGVTSHSQAAEPETKVIIHYEAPDTEKELERKIWLWADNAAGQELAFTGQDKFGKYAEVSVPGIHEKVGF